MESRQKNSDNKQDFTEQNFQPKFTDNSQDTDEVQYNDREQHETTNIEVQSAEWLHDATFTQHQERTSPFEISQKNLNTISNEHNLDENHSRCLSANITAGSKLSHSQKHINQTRQMYQSYQSKPPFDSQINNYEIQGQNSKQSNNMFAAQYSEGVDNSQIPQIARIPQFKPMKIRPVTVFRKSQKSAAIKQSISASLFAQNIYQTNVNSSNATITIDPPFDLTKLRPRKLKQECERLFDDVIKQKVTTNSLHDENIKLRTRLHFTYNQLAKKEKTIKEIIELQQMQENNSQAINTKIDSESYKRRIKELFMDIRQKHDQIEVLKKNIKNTKTNEMEMQLKTYADECVRLRDQLNEEIRNKIINDQLPLKIQQLTHMLELRDQNIIEMTQANVHLKDDLNQKVYLVNQYLEHINQMESRGSLEIQKLNQCIEEQIIYKRDLVEKIKQLQEELNQIKKVVKYEQGCQTNLQNNDMIQYEEILQQSTEDQMKFEKLQHDTQKIISGKEEQILLLQSEVDQKNRNVESLTVENCELKSQLEQHNEKIFTQQTTICDLKTSIESYKSQFHTFEHEMALLKNLSCERLDQIHELETKLNATLAQQEVAKETVPLKQHSADNTLEIKIVDANELKEEALRLKLHLQKNCVFRNEINHFMFKTGQTQVNGSDLNKIITNFKIYSSKQIDMLTYYLISNNVEKQQSCEMITQKLQDLVGNYEVYSYDITLNATLKKQVFEKLGDQRAQLKKELKDMDNKQKNVLKLEQIRDTIVKVCPEIISEQLEWILYQVYDRSDSFELMVYKELIQLLELEDLKVSLSCEEDAFFQFVE